MANFRIVEVEKTPQLPAEVREVPTVYDGKTVYGGKNAFKWFNDVSVEYLDPSPPLTAGGMQINNFFLLRGH